MPLEVREKFRCIFASYCNFHILLKRTARAATAGRRRTPGADTATTTATAIRAVWERRRNVGGRYPSCDGCAPRARLLSCP